MLHVHGDVYSVLYVPGAFMLHPAEALDELELGALQYAGCVLGLWVQ